MNARMLAAVVASAVTGAGAALGVAYAVPDPAGVIHACYQKGGLLQQPGDLRVTGDGTCKSTENPLSWNQAGQPGPAGPKGDKGDPGLPSTAYHARGESTVLPDTGPAVPVVSVTVPPGAYVVQAKAWAANVHSNWTGSRTGGCRLYEGESIVDFSFLSFAGNAHRAMVGLLAARPVTQSTTYEVRCDSAEPKVTLHDPVVVATRVGDLG